MKLYDSNSFQDWMIQFGSEEVYLETVAKIRCPEGIQCPRFGYDQAYVLKRHFCRQCRNSAFQASPTV